jgi:hypothetical protein
MSVTTDWDWDQSYPPGLLRGSQPVPNPPTGFVAGKPGSFTPAGSDVPADYGELDALGLTGTTFALDEYVLLGDGMAVRYDGASWEKVYAADATPGQPGAFLPAVAEIPYTLSALKGDPTVGDSAWSTAGAGAWTTSGDYVALGDGSHAYWDGSEWQAGEVPAPAPPAPDPDPCEDD